MCETSRKVPVGDKTQEIFVTCKGDPNYPVVPPLHTATCILGDPTADQAAENPVTGTITLTQQTATSAVVYSGEVNGLSEGLHGFHTHASGTITDSCDGANGHFNPLDKQHAGPDIDFADRHAGAHGNIQADAEGLAKVDKTVDGVSLADPDGSTYIIGRAIVVHAGEDDLGLGGAFLEDGTTPDETKTSSLANGNAGARVACCVITEVAKVEEAASRIFASATLIALTTYLMY